jgi:hypothetical protein
MKTQTSRYHRPGYSGVYQQQGRMLTDADWNEMVETLKERLAEALAQVIGSGAPRENGLLLFSDADSPRNWTQHNVFRPSGLAIVDGIAARLPSAWTITAMGPAAESDVTAFDALLLENGLRKDVKSGSYLEFEARRIQEAFLSIGAEVACDMLDASTNSGEWMYLNQATLPNAPPFPDTEAPTSLVARPAALEAARGTDEETDVSAAVAGPGETPPTVPEPEVTFQVYLDVWERTVTALEDPSLADAALYGADTTTRSYVMAQLKLAPFLTGNPDDPSGYPSKGNLHLSAKLVTDATTTMDPCLTETAVDARHETFLLRVEIHEATDAGLTIKWSTENGAEAFLVRDAPDEFKEGPGTFEFFNEATEKSLGLHLVPGFSPPVGELLPEWPNRPPVGFPFVRRWDGYAKLTLPAGDIARGSSSPASASVRVDSGKLLFLVGNAARIEVRIDLPDARGKLAMRGDYWLIEVRDDAPSARRVTFSQSPLGVTHHYLPLFRVSGGIIEDFSTDDPARTAHFRRLRFPQFSQLNLEDVDRIVGLIDGLTANKVSRSGDTMTGPLRMRLAPRTSPPPPRPSLPLLDRPPSLLSGLPVDLPIRRGRSTLPNLELTPEGDIRYSGKLNNLNVVVGDGDPSAQSLHARIQASDLWLGHPQRLGRPARALVDHGQQDGLGLVINYRDGSDAGWDKVHIGGPITVTDPAGKELLTWDATHGLWQHRHGPAGSATTLPMGGTAGVIEFQREATVTNLDTGLGSVTQCLILYEETSTGGRVPATNAVWSQRDAGPVVISANNPCTVFWFAFAVRNLRRTSVGSVPEVHIRGPDEQTYGESVTLTAQVEGLTNPTVSWQFDGGTAVEGANYTLPQDTLPGLYDLTVTATVDQTSASRTVQITVKPKVSIGVVKGTDGAAAPYLQFDAEVEPDNSTTTRRWTLVGATLPRGQGRGTFVRLYSGDIAPRTTFNIPTQVTATLLVSVNGVSNEAQARSEA